MDDKLLAGLGTAAVIAPLCAVCVLGPAAIAAMFTGVAGWLGGFDAAGLVLVVGIVVFAMARKRNAQRVPAKPAGEVGR